MEATDIIGRPIAPRDFIATAQPMGAGATQHICEILDIEYRRPRYHGRDKPGRTKTLICEPHEATFYHLKVRILWSTRDKRVWSRPSWQSQLKPNTLKTTENVVKLPVARVLEFFKDNEVEL